MTGGGHPPSTDELGTSASSDGSSDSFDALLEAAVSPSEVSLPADPRARRFSRLAIGTRVSGRFVVEWYAGAGGMGDVYRCQDLEGKQTVALKVIREASDQARFRREVAILAALSHEAIVRYVAHGSSDSGTPYLAMEWLEGEDLGRRLKRNRLSVQDSIALTRRICSALSLAHAHGFTHRDIKPSNVFLCEGRVERAKLLDFGVAHRGAATQTATRAGTLLGTVGYMAPEQASGTRLPDPRDDLFSLGCVLFECLTGRPAFRGESSVAVLESVLHSEPPDVHGLQPDVSVELASLVRRLLSKDRNQRPAEVSLVLAALDLVEAQRHDASAGLALASAATWRVAPATYAADVFVWGTEMSDGRAQAAELVDELARRHGAMQLRTEAGAPFLRVAADREITLVDLAERALQLAQELVQARPNLTLSVCSLTEGPATAPQLRPGTVFVDDLTLALCRTRAETENLRLPACIECVDDARSLPHALPFVGRDTELATLTAVFDECAGDEVARTLLVSAPRGHGKSRLAAEFLARFETRRSAEPWVLSVKARPVDSAVPWSLLRALLRAAALRARALAPAEALPSAELQGSLTDMLERASAASPLILCIDDAHWADLPSMQSLETVLAALAERRVFVLGLARTDMRGDLRAVWQATGAHALHLRPLRGRAAERLIQLATPTPRAGAGPSSATFDAGSDSVWLQLELAEGDLRLLRALLAVPLAVPRAADSAAFPAAIALFQERLARLSRTTLNVLGAASVFGARCWASGIAAILESKTGLERELTTLSAHKLLAPQGEARFASEVEYAFTHPLVREATYRMLGPSERTSAQRRAKLWLAQMGVTDLELGPPPDL